MLLALILVTIVLPSTITLLVPRRALLPWLILLTLVATWLLSDPLDGPGAVFAAAGLYVIIGVNAFAILARGMMAVSKGWG